MAVAIRFLVLTSVVPLVLILTECSTQKFEGIDASFFVSPKGVMASPKRHSDSEVTFFNVWY